MPTEDFLPAIRSTITVLMGTYETGAMLTALWDREVVKS
jgi:hypothetical protein